MTTIVEFLTARLDEDEAVAREVLADAQRDDASRGDRTYDSTDGTPYTNNADSSGDYIVAVPPARVLREVAAKRSVVAEHALIVLDDVESCECCSCWTVEDSYPVAYPCPTICHLAAVYSDAPTYDERWAVE